MKPSVLLALLLGILSFSLTSNLAFGHYGEVLSGYGTATIDGERSLGEWDGAHIIPVFGGKSDSSMLLVMNDEENLYFGLYVIDNLLTPDDQVGVMFDNSHNGILDVNDDSGGFIGSGDVMDGHYDGAEWVTDTRFSGDAAGKHDGTRNFIEFSKPLKSGDENDFNLAVGDIVGFCLTYVRDGFATDTTQYGPSCRLVANDQKLYGDIKILPYSIVWHGLMAMDADKRNINYGEVVNYEGYLYGNRPIEGQQVTVKITEQETGKSVFTKAIDPGSDTVKYFENTAWKFDFSVDTSKNNFEDGRTYVVEAKYVDETTKLTFFIKEDTKPELVEKATEAGKAITEAGKETGELVLEAGKEAGKVIVEKGGETAEKGAIVGEVVVEKGKETGQAIVEKGSEGLEEIQDRGGGCLIATAAYGSELSAHVQELRELRDNKLSQTKSGTIFMNGFNNFYYSFSPAIADYQRENSSFKEIVKLSITPMISSLSVLHQVDMNSEVEVIGYGLSLILLNIGMYVGIPIAIVIGIRRITQKKIS
ncbi:MAG: CFI-box-CTERM domain-containing protein [Nitrosopumilaceae archaeon]|nr:CFI-box-CTERM domain-containing protein [Nitrosopumilaceae archaeon]